MRRPETVANQFASSPDGGQTVASPRTPVPTLRGWRCLSGAISLLLGVCACAGPMEDDRQGLDVSARVVAAEALARGSAEPASAVEALTGGRTKVVWIQDLGDATDVFGVGGQLVLMGFDSGDDRGERVILDTPGSYAKPQITPSGNRIIYGDRLAGAVIVDPVESLGQPPEVPLVDALALVRDRDDQARPA